MQFDPRLPPPPAPPPPLPPTVKHRRVGCYISKSCQSEKRKTEQAYSFRFYFLVTNQYYKETNKPATKSYYFCNQYFAYNLRHKYPLEYQSKYLPHWTTFTEYQQRRFTKKNKITTEKNNGCSYIKVQGSSWTCCQALYKHNHNVKLYINIK